MTNFINPISIFPDLPRSLLSDPIVDKEGRMKDLLGIFLDQLVLALQTNFNNQGIAVPQQTSSNIILLTGTQYSGNILYDSTTNQFKGNVNGVWKTFTLV